MRVSVAVPSKDVLEQVAEDQATYQDQIMSSLGKVMISDSPLRLQMHRSKPIPALHLLQRALEQSLAVRVR